MKLWQRRVVGVLALGGGSIGAASALTLLLQQRNPVELLFTTSFLAVYAWGVWCGVRMLEGQPGAERSNVPYWLVQVPVLASPLFGYSISSGFHFTVALQPAAWNIKVNTLLGSDFNYTILRADTPITFGINFFALAVALWLLREAHRLPPNSSFKPTPLSGAA